MQSTTLDFDDLTASLVHVDAPRRFTVLRRIVDLFIARRSTMGARNADLVEDVILRLTQSLELEARIALSQQLAESGDAPGKAVRDLAFDDDHQVATPVIERSPRLDDDDLVAIAEQKTMMHRLAMSRRLALTRRVTDALVAQGEVPVMCAMAANEGADISELGYLRLFQTAEEEEELGRILRARARLTPAQIEQLVAIARANVRATLLGELGEKMGRAIDSVVADLARKLAGQDPQGLLPVDLEISRQFVLLRARQRPITERDIAEWIGRNRIEDALAGIAHLAEVRIELVVNAFLAPQPEALIVVTRALDFSWATFKQLLARRGGAGLELPAIQAVFSRYDGLDPANAARILRFAARREGETRFPADAPAPVQPPAPAAIAAQRRSPERASLP